MSAKVCPQCNTEYGEEQLFCPKDGSTLKSKSANADLVGSIIQKVYHVKKKLGEGGMGTVYLAEHVKMGRKSALKVMNPGMVHDADAISRFNREAANASKINHPNVASVYDFGETEEGIIFLAMEYIEGPSLTKVIQDAGAFPPLRAAEITRQASEALSVAHDMGIVHRDLKPDNIMLASGRDGVDIAKVVDFGIAKAGADEGQKVTKTGMVVGTPEYMSPEQLSGDKLDGRSDTYSLALVAFNMMTGKLPFPAETAQESMVARLMEAPKRLAEMKMDVPWTEEVQAVMDKALSREADGRYQTAAEFGRELHKAVSHMAHHDVTAAHTAVIGRMSGGVADGKPAPAKTAVGVKQPTPVPATRIGVATPMAGEAAVPAAKSKMPLFATIGLVVVLGGGYAGYKAMSGRAPDSTALLNLQTPAGASGTVGATGATTPPPAPTVNLPRELESVGTMPEATVAQAEAILARLATLEDAAKNAPDSNFIQFRYLRARALMNAQQDKAACDSLYNIENRTVGTRFERAAKSLISACKSSP